ncbi:MAG: sigma-54-dependent Fis family transcriptional regulator [Candidatus Rokubacteria bacterium]|nr:sigma-54-dependent Fis family transcriptional regulator [Candidatus Rokubacteria bacterium]
MAGERILIVDDEKSIRTTLAAILNDEGYRPVAVGSGPEALARVGEEVPDLVILDIWLPDMDGIDTLAELKRQWPELPVIMVSGHGTIETAVKATKLGAYDYIEKPLSLENTLLVIDRALEHARLERENRLLKERIERAHQIIGTSPATNELRRQIATAAPTNGRVLIIGENGAGKELVARAVHALSVRRDRPFVEVNCAAIPDELIESELFGHEKGAFTGAVARRRGKFELADGGTLFLDEIGDMSLRTQAKVLRALEEQTVERIGGHEPIRVDVRVIAASNQSLSDLIAQGRFREDLFYRLNVIPIEVPALRRRKEDIPLLVDHFFKTFSAEYGKRPKTLSGDAMVHVMAYDWPGNVRELRNMVERLVIMTAGDTITPEDLPPPLRPRAFVALDAGNPQSLREARDAFERAFILAELRANGWNITRTSKQLGIGRVNLWRKLKAYGVTPPRKGDDAARPEA